MTANLMIIMIKMIMKTADSYYCENYRVYYQYCDDDDDDDDDDDHH